MKYSELPKEIKLQDDINSLLDANEELQQRIDKAIDILDNSLHYLNICVDNDIRPTQLASMILKNEIELDDDTSKEDKKIDYLDLDDLNKLIDASYNDYMLRRIIHKAFLETKGKINEIIDKVNGEYNE